MSPRRGAVLHGTGIAYDSIMRKRNTKAMRKQKITRGNASQFFVAGELCRRGYSAVVTLGNTPNTDILCSDLDGTRFVHIQVKTFVPGNRTCSVGTKAEKRYGGNFFWVLGGIPEPGCTSQFEYYVIPSATMARHVGQAHRKWLRTPGKKGQPHRECAMRTVLLPPFKKPEEWNIARYRNAWDRIERKLGPRPHR